MLLRPVVLRGDRVAGLRMAPSTVGRAPATVRAAPKVAELFYRSVEWRRLVADIKRRRGAFCERCGSSHRLIGDHIVERRAGGAELDETNVELLCQACHNRKTATARARRARGG